jgi:hypothetical protein
MHVATDRSEDHRIDLKRNQPRFHQPQHTVFLNFTTKPAWFNAHGSLELVAPRE